MCQDGFKADSRLQGHVANEVETEQIVSETNTTPLWSIPARHDTLPQSIGRRVKMSPKYTAFVQLRGSIPVFWTQVAGNMQAKPPIHSAFLEELTLCSLISSCHSNSSCCGSVFLCRRPTL